MLVSNEDLEVWVKQSCYWTAWKHFKQKFDLEVFRIKSNAVLWGQ